MTKIEAQGRLPSSLHMLALALSIAVSGLLPSTAPLLVPTARCTARTAPLTLSLRDERTESGKVCAISAIAGSLASAPVKLSTLYASNAFVKSSTLGQWEFSITVLAVQLALFGVVYRAAVRCDDNDNLKQGAVGAAALCRALSALPVSNSWTPETWLQLGVFFGEGALAFGCAATAIEFAWDKGWATPLQGVAPVLYEEDDFVQQRRYYDQRNDNRNNYYTRDSSRNVRNEQVPLGSRLLPGSRGGNNPSRRVGTYDRTYDPRYDRYDPRYERYDPRRPRRFEGDDPAYYRDDSSIAGATTRPPQRTITDKMRE